MPFLYHVLATPIIQQITSQSITAHSKLPSLRSFAQQHAVSLSTAQACYVWLEAQGYIYAKKKSGYFVQPQHPTSPIEDAITFSSVPREVSNFALFNQIQEASEQNTMIHLGAIQLGAPLIPIQSLRKSIQRALKHSQSEDFLYCNRQGHVKLREALQHLWASDGIHIAHQDIFITNGCMAAISLILQNLTEVGDAVIIPTPTFNGQLQLLASLKRHIIEIPAHQNGINLEQFEQVLKTQTAKVCLLTANFQNPLGYCLTNTEKQKIAQLAEKYQCYIIEDDIYAECGYTQQRPLPIKYWDKAGYVILVGSVSKSLSSAYRIGWICLSEKIQHLKSNLLSNNVMVNTPLQLGLADFIYSNGYKQHIEQLRQRLFLQVQQYIKHIQLFFPTVQIQQPQGGYALWIKLPQHIDVFALYEFARRHSISIVPGIVFGEDEKYKQYMRINAGHPITSEIVDAIQKLGDYF